MSQELGVGPVLAEAGISLTQFWGGTDRGTCVQVTAPSSLGVQTHIIQLTAIEAQELAVCLQRWAETQE
jgi:hypothetical protein